MKIDCNLCDCSISISLDKNKTMNAVQVHFFGNRHRWNIEDVQNPSRDPADFSLYCSICDERFWMDIGSYDGALGDVDKHINGYYHEENVNNFYNGNNENDNSYESDQSSYYDESSNYDGSCTDDYSDNSYDDSYMEEEEYEEEEEEEYTVDYDDSDYQGEESDDEQISLIFNCLTCACNVAVSTCNESTIDNLTEHIQGQSHQSNANGSVKRMVCMICDCKINLSVDPDISISNLIQHIYGSRHCNKVGQNVDPEVGGLYYPD